MLSSLRKPYIILLLIMLLGDGLRVFDLGSKSFWVDELLSLQSSQDIVDVKSFLATNTINAHPPLYFLFLKIWSFFGSGEVYLRMLSVILGVLTILATYLLARQFFKKEPALLASLLVAISPFLLLHDREVRMYPLFVFFTVVSIFFFIKALREDKNKYWAGFVFFTVLNLYTHYHAFLVVVSMWLFYFLGFGSYKHLWKKGLLSQLIIALCFSFWVPSFIVHLKKWSVIGEGFDRFPTIFGFWVKPVYLFFSYSLGQTILPWNLIIVIPGLIIFIIAFLLGIKSIVNSKETFTFFSIFLLFPVFLSLFISSSMPRYMVFLAPIFYLIVGQGISEITHARLKIISVFLIIIVLGFSLKNYYQNREFHILANVDPWREVGQDLKGKTQKEDYLISIGDNLTLCYYSGLKIMDFGNDPVKKLNQLRDKNKNLWLVVSHPAYLKQAEKGVGWLNKHYNLISEKRYFYDPDYINKAKFFRKDFLEYRVKIYLYGGRRN